MEVCLWSRFRRPQTRGMDCKLGVVPPSGDFRVGWFLDALRTETLDGAENYSVRCANLSEKLDGSTDR